MQQAAGRHPQREAMRKLALQQPLEQQGCGERQRSWAVEVMLIAMFLGLLVARWRLEAGGYESLLIVLAWAEFGFSRESTPS